MDVEDYALSIVLPVFNEQEVIEKSVLAIHSYASRLIRDVEIIAVDDGSTDQTPQILDRLARILPHMRIVSHAKNKGYGGALISGIKAAQKPWILLIDSDGQIEIGSLAEAWPKRNGHEMILGFREGRADNRYRRFMGKTGNTFSNIFLGHDLTDINCGFKLFKKDLIQPLTLTSSGGIINFEILYQIFRNKPAVRWCESSVAHYPRKTGKSTGGNPVTIVKIIWEGAKIVLSSRNNSSAGRTGLWHIE